MTAIDVIQENEQHSISFSNPDLSVDQIIELSSSVKIDDVVNGLNSGELTANLNHGVDPEFEPWIVNANGDKLALVIEQRVVVTGSNFGEFEHHIE